MEQIASFTIDHLRLEPGVYVSRVDRDPASGAVITTFDLRLTAPNREPVMDTAAVHAIEHLLATYLRSSAYADNIVYFGPMGCRTGFYLLTIGMAPDEVCALLREVIALSFEETAVPGAAEEQCGNYRDLSLREGVDALREFLPKCTKRQYKPLVLQ